MTVIDDQTINIRIAFLELEKEKLERMQAKANDNEDMATLAQEIYGIEKVLEEMDNWLKIINRDPGWGELVNIAGKKIPKLPTFSNKEEMKYRLNNPDKHWAEGGLDHEQTARAREYNAKTNAQEAVRHMDGEGPIAAMEREGLSEEEIDQRLKDVVCPTQSASHKEPH